MRSMKGKQYLTRSEDFDRVYHHKASWASGQLVLRAAPNRMALSRYGYSISKRVGNAVRRNLTRRHLREILRQITLKPGWDIVFIARPAAANVRYGELKKTVEGLLSRAKLLGEKNEIPCVSTD
jgi:ribonuclease P protein component